MIKQHVKKGLGVEKLSSIFQGRANSTAFTLVELLVVIAIIAVLSAILLPALGQSGSSSKSFQCMENARRLTLGWQSYAEDNHDSLVLSSNDGTGTAPYRTTVAARFNQGNNYAWTWSKMDYMPDNPYDYDINADITLRPLWQYVKDATVYKCPADQSQALHNAIYFPRVRSYSMNYYLGGFAGINNVLGAVGGTWGKYYPLYLKLSDIGNLVSSPGPNQIYVFICERSDCINWGGFITDMSGYPYGTNQLNPALYQWDQDLPSSYHNLAANISFADEHVETHRWKVPSTYPPLAVGVLNGGHGSGFSVSAPYSQDVAWMQNVSARPH